MMGAKYKTVVAKPHRNRPPWWSKRIWENNIKMDRGK